MKTFLGWFPSLFRFVSQSALLLTLAGACFHAAGAEPPTKADSKVEDGQEIWDADAGLLRFEAHLKGTGSKAEEGIYTVSFEQAVMVGEEKATHRIGFRAQALQGGIREMRMVLGGEGEIRTVTAPGLVDWSVRQSVGGSRLLVLRWGKSDKGLAQVSGDIVAEASRKGPMDPFSALSFSLENPVLAQGYVRVDTDPSWEVRLAGGSGLIPLEPTLLPETLRRPRVQNAAEPLAFRFHGAPYVLSLQSTSRDPESRQVVLRDFHMEGDLREEGAAFTISAVAMVKNPKGGELRMLGGGAALTGKTVSEGWRWKLEDGHLVASFSKAGEYPIHFSFHAAVSSSNGWNKLDFFIAPAALQSVSFTGPGEHAEFLAPGSALPKRSGDRFVAFLPSSGHLELSWREAAAEREGVLFYSTESFSQMVIGPGVLRQTTLMDVKVMQGEMQELEFALSGSGEVTRLTGSQVLSWKVEPATASAPRKLVLRLNQPEKDRVRFQVQAQSSLGSFPNQVEPLVLRAAGAVRSGGYARLMTEGAVRLEVLEAVGWSQISPDQLPQSEANKPLLAIPSTQVFAFRFSGNEGGLRVQADDILPEVSVSEILTHHLGETEISVDGDLELEVREAPLRELLMRIPKGYAVARLTAPGLADYFLSDAADPGFSQLRLVYGTPVMGRQVVQFRLERNRATAETSWDLPSIEVLKAKSVRGSIAAGSDAGFRLTPTLTQGVSEMAPAFFPKKVPGIQSAFRLSDATGRVTLSVDRIPQSVQADAFHLFSVGEGIAYGSSLINYVVAGAPVSAFKIGLSNDVTSVEFTGKEVRSWQKSDDGYLVQLQTPVSGAYTLLATYERPFKPQGETLRFTGARALDAQSEQGYSLVVSAFQFQVQPETVSPGLVRLEPGEVPAEYRLLFDAPILAAYRYAARPYDLQLQLKPLSLGETVNQVVDRATLSTRISKEGQVITEAQYFVKSKAAANLRLKVPAGCELWSVTVNGHAVVPVNDKEDALIPLPAQNDANAVNDLRLKIASKAQVGNRIRVTSPQVMAPVLLLEWKVEPDAGRRLAFAGGAVTPVSGVSGTDGLDALLQFWKTRSAAQTTLPLVFALATLALSVWIFRISARGGVRRGFFAHWTGGLMAIAGAVGSAAVFFSLILDLAAATPPRARDLRFLVPVQHAAQGLDLQIDNLPMLFTWRELAFALSPVLALLGLLLWLRSRNASSTSSRWTTLAVWIVIWGAFRFPGGAPWGCSMLFFWILLIQLFPAFNLWRKAAAVAEGVPAPNVTGATAVWWLIGASFAILPSLQAASVPQSPPLAVVASHNPVADAVIQELRVEKGIVSGEVTIRWDAEVGQLLPILQSGATLTRFDSPEGVVRVVRLGSETAGGIGVVSSKTGPVSFQFSFQLPIANRGSDKGIQLPTSAAVVNTLKIQFVDQEVDLLAASAVSIHRLSHAGAGGSTFELVLPPQNAVWLGWRPKARDPRHEKPVYYAEWTQLFVPMAGVTEGIHQVEIRPAQGELSDLSFLVPTNATITDVTGGDLSTWRFQPETRQLRVKFNTPQSKAFILRIHSQNGSGPLPASVSVGLVQAEGAATQVGWVALATGAEVQLDDVQQTSLTTLHLEDFPDAAMEYFRSRVPGVTVRRAFRYADSAALLTMKASAVQPDVRVESQQTLSLGEDRSVFAMNLDVEITRAGLFKLSFALPTGFDVEAISGESMSHWTELKTDAARVITMHLKTRTEGRQAFSLTLVGPGVKSGSGWKVPRVSLVEAAKQRGSLLIVPEQGLKLQPVLREGLTQTDPAKSGVKQKGAVAFRLLQGDWNLTLDLERIPAWTQVTSLQQVELTEALVRVAANLQFEIDHAGMSVLQIQLPATAESVRFRGDQVADFRRLDGAGNEPTRDWEVKLQRRQIGKVLLQVNYSIPTSEKATSLVVRGVDVRGVNQHRGFLAIQSDGRLQARVDSLPPQLQPTEWQSIPRMLQQDIRTETAGMVYRVIEPGFELPIRLERHAVAQLLPARVQSVALTSVASDEGELLTQVKVELIPGDKQLLHVRLPSSSRFWFAFVNQASVWHWQEKEEILIPLEHPARSGEPITVEFLYGSTGGRDRGTLLDLQLLGPKFDLPLENITWKVHLGNQWRLKDWSGSLQLQEKSEISDPISVSVEDYVKREESVQKDKSREAEHFLSLANNLLQQGDPEQARRAFQSAYGLSTHDNAFNEDARVQLHNLKTQQALIGLNVRQAKVAGETGLLAAAPRNVREGLTRNYTQEEAKQLLDKNSAEENAVQTRLVERLIQQQEAVMPRPAAIRPSIPDQGPVLTFTRALQVENWADLGLSIQARSVQTGSGPTRVLVLVGVGLLLWMIQNTGGKETRRVS